MLHAAVLDLALRVAKVKDETVLDDALTHARYCHPKEHRPWNA